ncbi:MAG: sigma-54-dependent Fis family transcriptional regulator [Planctomycetota bacterium]|nr:MAG: sigma-54-dependent Fis family transcriptional regulator [Planctomycetota bacterium]
MRRILVIDDKDLMRESLADTLQGSGHAVIACASGEEGVKAVSVNNFDLVITDLKMPKMSGIDVVKALRKIDPDVPVVVITAYATIATAVAAMKEGAFDYIQKPFKADALDVIVKKAFELVDLRRENEYLRGELKDRLSEEFVLGNSSAMAGVARLIEKAATSPATVLITGGSGTGKELVARALHFRGPRRSKPFVAVNCAALSSGVLESELFGHERGAFTSATEQRKGRFEVADGGTILLDEVSEMDDELQAKLLRVLQEKTFERVGSNTPITVDVRVVATTNRDLPRAVAEGSFREDLYYRLNVININVPPLQERLEDVEPLAMHFLKKSGSQIKLAPDALHVLMEYSWPGNVRELENIIERAVVLSSSEVITAADIASGLGGVYSSAGRLEALVRKAPLEELERFVIEERLKQLGWHQEKTAKSLSIGVRTLRDKIKKWDLKKNP